MAGIGKLDKPEEQADIIDMVKERLNKFIAGAGIASRRKADELIAAGLIKVNSQVVTELGWQINPQVDRVEYQGREVKPAVPLLFMFNKPKGVTSTLSDRYASKTITDYFKGMSRVYPVGRLDKDSEGLMLVTNDGDLANQLTHPRYEHEKEYEVVIEKMPLIVIPAKAGIQARKQLSLDPRVKPEDDIKKKFSQEFVLDGYKIRPMRVRLIKKINLPHPTSPYQGEERRGYWLISLILQEGRKRQIRRVAEILGYKVTRLKRVRIGRLTLGNLPIGEYRAVSTSDII